MGRSSHWNTNKKSLIEKYKQDTNKKSLIHKHEQDNQDKQDKQSNEYDKEEGGQQNLKIRDHCQHLNFAKKGLIKKYKQYKQEKEGK